MPLPSPKLIDYSFDELIERSLALFKAKHPESNWNDLSPSDPGRVLLELFAHLAETMIYRLNQMPEEVYIALLDLIGVRMRSPGAAQVELVFSREASAAQTEVMIPAGTQVSAERAADSGDPVIFTTAQNVTLAAGETQVAALAFHGTVINGELLGVSSGQVGQKFTVAQPPIVARSQEHRHLVVGIEADPSQLPVDAERITREDKTYHIWDEVEQFSISGGERFCFRVDRVNGLIEFAPMILLSGDESSRPLAEIPADKAEIRVWYVSGGGTIGNVAPRTLNTLKTPLPGISVTNPARAAGGTQAETIDNVLIRGPLELQSLSRVITASDFEAAVTQYSGFIERAHVFAQAGFWAHAQPGTVEIAALPKLNDSTRDRISLAEMNALISDLDQQDARASVERLLDSRRPVGTRSLVHWANFKSVRVQAEILARPLEDVERLRKEVETRLYELISPYPTKENGEGWRFGETLRVSEIYNRILKSPGVAWIRTITMMVDDVPDRQVQTIAYDQHQPRTWYIGSGERIFRSLNGGASWELLRSFEDEQVLLARSSPHQPGWIAVITRQPTAVGIGVNVYFSADCGESWHANPVVLGSIVYDAAWVMRGDLPILLAAADQGLFEIAPNEDVPTRQLIVDRAAPSRGFYAIATFNDAFVNYVAIAAADRQGVYVSTAGGKSNSFRYLAGADRRGLRGEDVRSLTIQETGSSAYLWAGTAAAGGDSVGSGCFVYTLRGIEGSPEGWRQVNNGWAGGTCWSLFADQETLYATTNRQGLVTLKTSVPESEYEWQNADIRGGLPLRRDGIFRGQFTELRTGAMHPQEGSFFVGCEEGVFASQDGVTFRFAAANTFTEQIDLPGSWLFVSGKHDIKVVAANGR